MPTIAEFEEFYTSKAAHKHDIQALNKRNLNKNGEVKDKGEKRTRRPRIFFFVSFFFESMKRCPARTLLNIWFHHDAKLTLLQCTET